MTGRAFMGIPREQFSWAPRIDPELCIGCGDCLEFCPNGVFVLDEQENKMKVASPDNCVVLCDKCAASCSEEAISFPDKGQTKKHLREMLQDMAERKRERSQQG